MIAMGIKEVKQALAAIKRNGLNPALYVVITEIENRFIVKHRITGEIKVLDK